VIEGSAGTATIHGHGGIEPATTPGESFGDRLASLFWFVTTSFGRQEETLELCASYWQKRKLPGFSGGKLIAMEKGKT
jgi:hypothetical protein